MTNERYRECYEYVICEWCNSHILLDLENRKDYFEYDDENETQVWSFTCDNFECESDILAEVKNPWLIPKEFTEKYIVNDLTYELDFDAWDKYYDIIDKGKLGIKDGKFYIGHNDAWSDSFDEIEDAIEFLEKINSKNTLTYNT